MIIIEISETKKHIKMINSNQPYDLEVKFFHHKKSYNSPVRYLLMILKLDRIKWNEIVKEKYEMSFQKK
jgi:hypothetical protein